MKKKWVLLVLGAGGVAIAVLASIVGYAFLTHPGRLTTRPVESGLRRTVTGNTLVSDADPAVRMTFDDRFEYLGGQKFVLYGTADTEQHFFVEPHPDGRLKSIFWIQFEAFLPDNEYTYDYSGSPLRTQVGTFDFFTDTAAGRTDPIRIEWPGTDGALARSFVADRGYAWPDDFAYARLAHLPDDARRTELLIFFIDDLAPTGRTAAELRAGGADEDRWPEIEAAHLDRIRRVMTLSRPDGD